MPPKRIRTLVLAALAAAIVSGAAALLLLQSRCNDGGGDFRWTEVSCEVGARPILFNSEIHRV